MIQRIQSVYLLVALVLQFLMLFLRWSTYVQEDAAYVLSGTASSHQEINAMPLLAAIVINTVLILVVFLSYKNRKQQLRLANVAMVQSVVILAIFSWIHYKVIEVLKAIGTLEIGYGVAVVLPIITIILIWLAKRGIRKDEELVKSVDRLR